MTWFTGEPTFQDEPRVPVYRRWVCPQEGCGGEMVFSGASWMTVPPGHQHICDRCGFGAVLKNTYPKIVFLEAK